MALFIGLLNFITRKTFGINPVSRIGSAAVDDGLMQQGLFPTAGYCDLRCCLMLLPGAGASGGFCMCLYLWFSSVSFSLFPTWSQGIVCSLFRTFAMYCDFFVHARSTRAPHTTLRSSFSSYQLFTLNNSTMRDLSKFTRAIIACVYFCSEYGASRKSSRKLYCFV